ncbi:MAG: hypothetical protein IPO90_05060 [Flavobacteriales bacterium]|nr:hypothetical protein [Flavobacteriales bacterium]MBL0042931.1 hypothetical protein [Flavobacteriales bacterium]
MMAYKFLNWAASTSLAIALIGCGSGGDEHNGRTSNADTLDTTAKTTEAGLMVIGGKIFSIPSPVQTALLIRKLGLPYEKSLPMPADAIEKFVTKAQRSLALGAYGADLAYVTVHKDGQRALNTLQVVQKISAQLELSNAFDQEMMDGFKKSISNEDSLLRFTGKAFRMADQYLKNNNRDDVSALVLAGGWIEGMYLTLSNTNEKSDASLTDRLGDQRKTIENLIMLLERTDTEKSQGALIAGLKDALSAYAGVTTAYQFQTPTVDAEKKTTYVNSTSTVSMTPEQFKAIAAKVKALRTLITA